MFINKSPHEVKILLGDGQAIAIQPTAPSARISTALAERDPIDGIPFAETVFGAVENLPEMAICPICANPQYGPPACEQCGQVWDGPYYIVSSIVIGALPNRPDLVRPDTGPDCIRDKQGRIVAVRRLTR